MAISKFIGTNFVEIAFIACGLSGGNDVNDVHRGGAREASVATLTGDVDGSSRYMYIYTCVKPLGQLHHAQIYFYRERKPWKKDLLLWSGLEPGSDALQTTAFATEPMGLWQLWTANLALILLTAAVRDHGHQGYLHGESQQTQALQGILTVLF